MSNKAAKQELTEPDKIQVLLGQVRDYVLTHKRNIAVATTIVLAVFVLIGGWSYYRQTQETKAMNLYSKAAMDTIRTRMAGQDATAAIKPLQEVVEKYPSTEAATLARYRIGNAYLNAGQIDAALKAFQGYLKDKSGENELTVLVYNGLGNCYEVKKDYKNALLQYEMALNAKAGKPFAGDILANLARTYEAMKDNKKAVEYYQKSMDKTNDPAMKLIIGRKIAILG
ncbi:MAG: tetratricopeptide repeat protein [Syntrophales bacterium]|jgi:tetratricopeptide (TPR) repeat protein|nr:tetratricopeptide repeat protein [Syntrophales bacterium]MCK9392943.1 tetratricopeptide repeat protein [Syntrophales bacterium]